MTDRKEIREKLWNSLDMAQIRLMLILPLLIAAAALTVSLLFTGGITLREKLLGGAAIVAVAWLPFVIYCLYHTVRIYRHVDAYRIYRTKLGKPQNGFPRGMQYFTVVLEDAEGKFLANTRTVFQAWGQTGIVATDYIGETVTVAYNEETHEVVVLG